MDFCRSFVILLTITVSLILIALRIKAEETEFGCTGKLLETNIGGSRNLERIQHNLNDLKIPEKFDSREKWPFCKTLLHIKYQGKCGGCWAFASSSVMSDRLCIATGGKIDKILSEQDLLECCSQCVGAAKNRIGGCQGGFAYNAFEYWKEHGLVTGAGGCKPTEEFIIRGTVQSECRPKCTNESYKVEYEKDRTFSVKTFRTVRAQKSELPHIMAEIMLNGPVFGGMYTYKYMYNVPSNAIIVYNQSLIKDGEKPSGHAIKIIGWDNINNTPVWIFANTWGNKWCNKGFCYIKRGNNELKIEEFSFIAGIPKVETSVKKKKQSENTESSGSKIIKIANLIEVPIFLCILIM